METNPVNNDLVKTNADETSLTTDLVKPEHEDMGFESALELLKMGARVRRRCWGSDGFYLELRNIDEHNKLKHRRIYVRHPAEPAELAVPWLVSQDSILVEDWILVAEPVAEKQVSHESALARLVFTGFAKLISVFEKGK